MILYIKNKFLKIKDGWNGIQYVGTIKKSKINWDEEEKEPKSEGETGTNFWFC